MTIPSTPPEAPEVPVTPGPDGPPPPAGPTETPPADPVVPADPDTFPRAYVEQLRQESAGYRTRAQQADTLAERLLTATVREATAGILTDPTDLPTGDALLDADGMPDPDLIAEAARALVTRKPHLGDRRPRGDVDQGARTSAGEVNLAGMLRSRAS